MPNTKDLLERKKSLAVEIRKAADKSNTADRKWESSDQENWDNLNADFDATDRALKISARADALDAEIADTHLMPNGQPKPGLEDRKSNLNGAVNVEDTPDDAPDETRFDGDPEGPCQNVLQGGTQRDLDAALRGWAKFGKRELRDSERQALKKTRINPQNNELYIPLYRGNYDQLRRKVRAEKRVGLIAGANPGIEIIPQGFVAAWERSMLYFGGMREVATVIRTDSGNALPYPTTNDTANVGVLLAEETTVGASVNPTIAAITFNAYKYSSKLIQVSPELLQDTAFDLPSILGSMLGERIARITNTHFTTGTGSAQPNGIATASAVGATLAVGNTLGFNSASAADGLFTLVHAVDRAYRQGGPNTGWLFHDANLGSLRKAKDTTNQYIWQPSLAVGENDLLLGYPVTINNDVAVFAANAEVAFFGALGKYIIRDVAGVRLRRLVERYADTDQEGFIAFVRTDGDMLDAGTDPVKSLAASAT